MNYIELINRFWQEVEMKDFLPSEACVYFRLLDVCNKLGWQNPFSLSNSRAVMLMAMNEKTFRAVRDKLGGRGLIEFRKGKKRESAPMYCFPEKTDEGWIFDWGNFLAVKNTANTPVNTPVNTPANTPAYNKTKTKTKKSPDGDNARMCEAAQQGLFGDEEKNKRQKAPPRSKLPQPPPPTLDEVKNYFLSHRADQCLKDWEHEAEVFFNHFTSLGWKTSSGAKVERWDSRANLWIVEHKQQRITADETGKDDKFSERRGSESTAKSRKGFNGTL